MKSDSTIQIIVGGDVSFDQEVRTIEYLGVYRLRKKEDEINDYQPTYPPWQTSSPFARLKLRMVDKLAKIWDAAKVHPKTLPPFEEFIAKIPENEHRRYVDNFARTAKMFSINYPTDRPIEEYPFAKINPFFKSKDFVFVNLETPLASGCRPCGYFMSKPRYAKAMADSGISMVNLANNHIFDAGEIGFLQTIGHLKDANILYAGAGENLQKARSGALVEIKQTSFIFLGYTQYCNSQFASIADEYPGILPLDVELIIEDIKNAKNRADMVFVALHWGIENKPKAHPRAREIAHSLIDAGVDGIIGHHPHVPQEIEIYKNKPILYSLGNFIHGHNREYLWSDNCLAELIISDKCIQKIIIYPVAGKGEDLFQPYLLIEKRARRVLKDLQAKSATLGTSISIENDHGIITL
jgi:poly-gamma-glutamate capsule biosynthesis protein CapA/YwtB (metallophosphatase superfamily)